MSTGTDIVALPPLTAEEDTFCLAVIECGGNLAAAYRLAFGSDTRTPVIKAQELLARPEVAMRLKKLADATQEHAMISLGSHMLQLAEIRDLAKDVGQFKVALAAERSRGEAAGFYKQQAVQQPNTPLPPAVQVVINNTAGSNDEWSAKFGKNAVIIDNPQ